MSFSIGLKSSKIKFHVFPNPLQMRAPLRSLLVREPKHATCHEQHQHIEEEEEIVHALAGLHHVVYKPCQFKQQRTIQ